MLLSTFKEGANEIRHHAIAFWRERQTIAGTLTLLRKQAFIETGFTENFLIAVCIGPLLVDVSAERERLDARHLYCESESSDVARLLMV